jgi:hypothetical protein
MVSGEGERYGDGGGVGGGVGGGGVRGEDGGVSTLLEWGQASQPASQGPAAVLTRLIQAMHYLLNA